MFKEYGKEKDQCNKCGECIIGSDISISISNMVGLSRCKRIREIELNKSGGLGGVTPNRWEIRRRRRR